MVDAAIGKFNLRKSPAAKDVIPTCILGQGSLCSHVEKEEEEEEEEEQKEEKGEEDGQEEKEEDIPAPVS